MSIPTLTFDELKLLYVAIGCAYPHMTDLDSILALCSIQNKFGTILADMELERAAIANGTLKYALDDMFYPNAPHSGDCP